MENFNHSGVAPRAISLDSLEEITKDFSIELGSGTFGKVYKVWFFFSLLYIINHSSVLLQHIDWSGKYEPYLLLEELLAHTRSAI